MAFLCVSLDKSTVNIVRLMNGELIDIDKYTSKYNNDKEILREYPEKIGEFNNRFNIDEDNITTVALRIFLSNDKERFIMYKKHLVAFRSLIINCEFLRYALANEKNLLDKTTRDIITNEDSSDNDIRICIKKAISELDEDAYYDLIRRFCYQYSNYLEDIDEELPTIDNIYNKYLDLVEEGKLDRTLELVPAKKKEVKNNPFAVFAHPKFAKTYGKALNKKRAIFILGGLVTDNTEDEYTELYDNCKSCFVNPIYYPFNSNVADPFNSEALNVFDSSLLVIVNGNEYNDTLAYKIKRAYEKGITTLILVKDNTLKQVFEEQFGNGDTIIIKDYKFQDYSSKKSFADIAVGLYINEYKKRQN